MKNSAWLWVPRILIMIVIVFLGMFGADAFEGTGTIWQKLLGFLIHSVPSIVLLLILIFTWKRPLIAGIIFIAIGLLMTLLFGHYRRWDWFLAIEFPVILIGATFLIFEFLVKEKHENTASND